jgi:hypothetical protein
MSEANRILVPGIRIVILDLVKHRFEEVRELCADSNSAPAKPSWSRCLKIQASQKSKP